MYVLEKEFTFEAAHKLPDHDGRCQRLHGHSWRGRVRVVGPYLQQDGAKAGMLADYGDLKAAVQPLVEQYLDHHYLNETLNMRHPTSENIARWLFERVRAHLVDLPGVRLRAVVIDETCTSRAEYGE